MAGVVGWKSSSSNRGRAYGMMLLLAFGAAVFGVLILHKLRERRLLNLLIKDKDRDILTLQLLLQKERDVSKGARAKIEEMKVKTVTLRNQKAELTNRLEQMQTIMVSLRQEIKSLEAALEEKENKIKFLEVREKNQPKEDLQALKYALKQKEEETEELKLRLEKQVKGSSESLANVTIAKEGVPSQDGQLRKPMENQNVKSLTTAVDDVVNTNDDQKKSERDSLDSRGLSEKGESHGEHMKVEGGTGRDSNSESLESSASSTSLNRTGENEVPDAAQEGLTFVKLKHTKLVKESGTPQVQKLGEYGGANPQEGSSESSLYGVESMTRGKGDNKKKSKSK
ncbi:hypothetical protein H6P81_005649 [Aristolochia fimbriata]|uniref:Micronuclear linker histone polyprotein n=1 Tax=Aristolochia fimbriata TaxID=158543 RepID=A0AAV7EV20_ARIFI|nr:hypothetical protein H6P81_005649 [Aristolochia fimbriata]